jgi:hypothetical protein
MAELQLGRMLVMDESLNEQRLAAELKRRGLNACSRRSLGLAGNDTELLRALFGTYPEHVLVTADDHMPGEHADLVAALGATIATIDGRRPPAYRAHQEHWENHVVHRWAHAMQVQPHATCRRYRATAHRPWSRRRRA